MSDRIPFRQSHNDLHADLRCLCGYTMMLAGYNDANFFDNVNAEARAQHCKKCGRLYAVRWFRDGVGVAALGKPEPASAPVAPQSLTPHQVQAAGLLMFGPNWTQHLSDRLGVSKRFLERVNQAAREGQATWDFPAGFITDLRTFAEERARTAREAADKLKEDTA